MLLPSLAPAAQAVKSAAIPAPASASLPNPKKCETREMCETTVPLKEQFTVTNDLTKGVPIKRKDAARKGAEKASHYCDGCADRRVKQKQAWLKARTKRLAKASA